MKEIKEERFKKKEDISFNPGSIPDKPNQQNTPIKRNSQERSNEQTFEQHNNLSANITGFRITIPERRRKSRQSFDIFDDQYDALKKLQVVEAEKEGTRVGPTLGIMVQEALDSYIKDKVKRLGNISLSKE